MMFGVDKEITKLQGEFEKAAGNYLLILVGVVMLIGALFSATKTETTVNTNIDTAGKAVQTAKTVAETAAVAA